MTRKVFWPVAASLFSVLSCAASGPEAETVPAAEVAAVEATALWNFETATDAIRETSCAEGGAPMRGMLPLNLTVAPLNERQVEVLSERIPTGAEFAGAWELTSTDPNFGGLSGLAVEDDTSLLAVTDAGGWVKLALNDDAPSGAAIGYMRGPGGRLLSGKNENDAEGLAVRDGIAFVSFERDFRVAAFAIGTCGAGANAVEIAALPGTFEGTVIDSNEGPEALKLSFGGELEFGFEAAPEGRSPLGHILADGAGAWTGKTASNPSGFALVSMDSVRLANGTDRDIYLYRSFDPLRGIRSVLAWGPGEDERIALSRPVMTDNFEGLAVQALPSGDVRLWIVSDNNFSEQQRTLIYAIDLNL